MGSVLGLKQFVFAIVVLAFFRTSTCDILAGHSAFADDLLVPVSNTSAASTDIIGDIFARQTQQRCTAGNPFVICGPGKCCSAADNCTPTGCCPKGSETCGGKLCVDKGSVCCGNVACRAGGVCKRSPGGQDVCCPSATDIACDSGKCCQAGYTCLSGGLCERTQTFTSRSSSTSSSTSTSSSSSRFTPTPTPTRSASRARRPSSISTTTEACSIASGNQKRQECETTSTCTTPASVPTEIASGWDWVQIDGLDDCVPVLDFFCVKDLFDQMCTSMCEGIRDQKNSNPDRVLDDRSILLHRRKGRNEAAGCRTKGCAQRVTYSGLYNGYVTMQCDEFPPASTMEGGGPTLTCIAGYQNGLGGVFLRWFYDDLKLDQDDPFIIRMDTCDFPATPVSYPQGSQPPIRRARQVDGNEIMNAAQQPRWFQNPRTDSEGYILMPLNTTGVGNYTGTLTLSEIKSLEDICIIDGSGEAQWNTTGKWPESTRDLQYEVQDDTQDLFVAAFASASVSVTAAFTATKSAPSSRSGATSRHALSGVVCFVLFAGVMSHFFIHW